MYLLFFCRCQYCGIFAQSKRTVEQEKQPLLANGSETKFVLDNDRKTDKGKMSVARQQILNNEE
jgi:hypothetical protein